MGGGWLVESRREGKGWSYGLVGAHGRHSVACLCSCACSLPLPLLLPINTLALGTLPVVLLLGVVAVAATTGGAHIELVPYSYLFKFHQQYCLGMFDNGYQGALLGGIITRNVLVQVCLCVWLCV